MRPVGTTNNINQTKQIKYKIIEKQKNEKFKKFINNKFISSNKSYICIIYTKTEMYKYIVL